MDYDSDEGPDQDDVNIDDGLLDDVFEGEVGPRNKKTGGGGDCSSCQAMVVCVMGGSNSQVRSSSSHPPPTSPAGSGVRRGTSRGW